MIDTWVSFLSPKFLGKWHFYFMSEAPKFKNLGFFKFFFCRGTSQIFRFKQFWPHFFTVWMVHFSNMIWWFSFPEIYPVSGYFPDFSGFSPNLQIFSQNKWFSSHIWCDDFLFRKFVRFPDSTQFFSEFSGFFRIFIKFSDFFTEWIVYSHIWYYNDFLLRIFSGFRIFPGFS